MLWNKIPLEPPTGEISANNPLSLNQLSLFSWLFMLSGPGHNELVPPEVGPSVISVLINVRENVPWSNAPGKCYSSGSLVGIWQVSRDPTGVLLSPTLLLPFPKRPSSWPADLLTTFGRRPPHHCHRHAFQTGHQHGHSCLYVCGIT